MPEDPKLNFDVFLSHAHVDAEAVEALGIRLREEAGLRVWLDRWILIPDESWQQHLSKALDEVHTCAVCIGEHTPTGWFKEEIERALNRQTRTQSFRVIPVILPGGSTAAVDGFLQSRTWVDFSAGINDGRAFHYLMCGVRGVAPGRYEEPHVAVDDQLGVLRDKLQSIRKFRQEHLIDPEIAIEYQRRVLDVLFNQ